VLERVRAMELLVRFAGFIFNEPPKMRTFSFAFFFFG